MSTGGTYNLTELARQLEPFLADQIAEAGIVAQTEGHIIQEDGVAQTQRSNLNFLTPLYANDDAGDDATDIGIAAATTSAAGIVQLATSGEASATKAVTGTDARLADDRDPNPHAASHGYLADDQLGSVTPSGYQIPRAGATGQLSDGWIDSLIARLYTAQNWTAEQTFEQGIAIFTTELIRWLNGATEIARLQANGTGGSGTNNTLTIQVPPATAGTGQLLLQGGAAMSIEIGGTAGDIKFKVGGSTILTASGGSVAVSGDISASDDITATDDITAGGTVQAADLIATGAFYTVNGKKITIDSAFLGSPANGDLCYRTDLGEWWFWNSTLSKWLSCAEYDISWSEIRALQPYGGTSIAIAVGAIDRRTGVDIYWTSCTIRSQIASGTNSVASRWDTSVQTSGGSGATLASRNTSADGNTATTTQFTVNTMADSGNQVAFLNVAKSGATGTPGNINVSADLRYRKARTS